VVVFSTLCLIIAALFSGVVLTLDHATCYAIVNAFRVALGTRAAAADGVRRRGVPSVRISAWTLGLFDDIYAEDTAADDLIARGVDTLLAISDNNDKVRARILAASTRTNSSFFGLGFYTDGRIESGDRVLLSAIYDFVELFKGTTTDSNSAQAVRLVLDASLHCTGTSPYYYDEAY
jgi:hypothetical protein